MPRFLNKPKTLWVVVDVNGNPEPGWQEGELVFRLSYREAAEQKRKREQMSGIPHTVVKYEMAPKKAKAVEYTRK